MRISVNYTTVYTYSEPPRSVIQLLRVTPLSFTGQTVLDWRVDVDCDSRVREGQDGYGNITHMLYIDRPVERLCISVSGAILTEDHAGVIAGVPNDLPPEVFSRVTELTAAGEAIRKLAAEVDSDGGTTLDRLHRLTAGLHQGLRFDTAMTEVETRGEDALAAGHGVCQDFAHIFIGASRFLGIPARYISGHLFRRDGAHLQQAAHAWAEAWVEHLGWVAFDPANGICADSAYVRVACGLDYRDAAPVAGERSGGGREKLSVEVDVREGRPQSQSQSQSQFQA